MSETGGPGYRWVVHAVHDAVTCDFWAVLYRVERSDGASGAKEWLVPAGSPPEKFREAYKAMHAEHARLNGLPPPEWDAAWAAGEEARRLFDMADAARRPA
jgi:hypothetical protein